jgi:hypothetical protein
MLLHPEPPTGESKGGGKESTKAQNAVRIKPGESVMFPNFNYSMRSFDGRCAAQDAWLLKRKYSEKILLFRNQTNIFLPKSINNGQKEWTWRIICKSFTPMKF